MIRPGFLTPESRRDLMDLARDGSAAHRLARRANALVLPDGGMGCAASARVPFVDDDTIRGWHRLYLLAGIEGLTGFGQGGSACRLTAEQRERLNARVTATLPRTANEVGAWIERECGVACESRSGLVALPRRPGMEYRPPAAIPRKLDPLKQRAFIEAYEALLNRLPADGAVLFADATHPTRAVRPAGCWAPRDTPLAVEQASGRERLNIQGAIDLESGRTVARDVPAVDALSTIVLLMAIEATYPNARLIHVFLDNARCHHARLVRAWLAGPERRIRLHFVPAYCPHPNPIERLWGLMHRHVTHNKCHPTFAAFRSAMLTFLRDQVPRSWREWCDQVTDNFRVIDPRDFRVLA